MPESVVRGRVEIAVGVEPDQADARGRAVRLLQPADHAGDGGAVAADDQHRLARAPPLGDRGGDLAADQTEIDRRLRVALLLRKLRLDDRRLAEQRRKHRTRRRRRSGHSPAGPLAALVADLHDMQPGSLSGSRCHVAHSSSPPSESRQNAEVSPWPRKIASASAAVRPRKSGDRRSPYQAFARFQLFSTERISPRGFPVREHQRATSSSDRKKRIDAQVAIRSSYQWRNGNGKWTTPSPPLHLSRFDRKPDRLAIPNRRFDAGIGV